MKKLMGAILVFVTGYLFGCLITENKYEDIDTEADDYIDYLESCINE